MKKKLFAILLCLVIILSSLSILSEVSFAEGKTFTVNKRVVGNTEDGTIVGNYDTLYAAFEACTQNDQTNEYVITVNNDYEIPKNEAVLSVQDVNILLKSAKGKKCTLKRLGTRVIFYVPRNCRMRVENVILDGNNDGELTFLTGNGELTLGKGTDVRNFIDVPSASGPAIYLTDSSTLNIEDGAIIKDNRSDANGGAIGANDDTTTININGGTFINNSSSKYGGVIATWGTLNVNGGTFEKNKSPYGGAIAAFKTATPTISNATFKGNTADEEGGAIISWSELTASKTTFENNEANWGGAIRSIKKLTLDEISFNKNNAKVAGGAIHLQVGAEIKNSTFTENSSVKDGGAIYTNDKKYENTVDALNDYQNLTIDEKTTFINNSAKGYFNPPENVNDLTNIKFKRTTFTGTNKIKPDSPLNNYDINYKRDIIVTYDPNDGNKVVVEQYQEQSIDNYEIKSVKALNFKNTAKFLGWSEDKNSTKPKYQAGQKINLTGNLYLYAIWENPAPKPSTTVILTLDENHRSGEITNIEAEEGELIAPYLYIPRRRGYIFKGWSYDRKHLDEVKPGDRIYSDTTLYAIWKKAEIEKVEEPEEIRGDDHKAYIFGYPNGTVRPNGSITRAEAAAMLARLLNIEAIGSAAKPNFIDTESSWYNKAINAVVQRGIMKGYLDGRFRPDAPITRAEFTQMISTIDNKPYGEAPFADVAGHWAERAIGSEYQAKRITGYPDGLFRPDANITRAEAAVILNKIFERNYDAMSLAKCKNPQMIKRFIDLNESFWAFNDMVEATNTHEYIRRNKGMLEEDWLLIK